jgi:hypothetical protein
MNKLLRVLSLSITCSAAMYAGACSDESTDREPESEDLSDVVYTEGADNDEALETMLAAKPQDDPSRAAVFDNPQGGAELPASSIPTFLWHTGTVSELLIVPPVRLAPAPAMLELLGPERAAHAHGPPINGKAYFLVFSTATNDELLRVFTVDTAYTPSESAWAKLKNADEPITASILTAAFTNNSLPADGGTFLGTPITFTVAP